MNKYRLAATPFAILDRMGFAPRPRQPVAYVVEAANWATRWDGILVNRGIEKLAPGKSRVVESPATLAHSLVHFFSHYQWLAWQPWLAGSNRFVVTFYHGKREDDAESARLIDAFLATVPRIERIVTSARLVEERLVAWGVPRSKIVRIPIPIDLDVFKPATAAERVAARLKLGLPDGHLVVGSFQKDGVGWGDGQKPKLVKGPDILIETLKHVARERPVVALLTGPARGYVTSGLAAAGILFKHVYVDDYEQLPAYYAALDVYLNPSREEGGPKGVLESMATNVPVVSSRVGMAPDLITHAVSGFLAGPSDSAALATAVLEAANLGPRAEALLQNARTAVSVCGVDVVAKMHWQHLIAPLLAEVDDHDRGR